MKHYTVGYARVSIQNVFVFDYGTIIVVLEN